MLPVFAARRISWALVPGALWLWLFWRLHDVWNLNPQYHYGWGVPFLAGLLFYLRWSARPTPSGERDLPGLSGGILFLLLPLRLIEEANPDWRLLSWTLALLVAGYSFVALDRAGGKTWVRHFVFPILFALVAVPWPARFENAVIQQMTHAVAYAAVEIAGWIGVGAFQIGNVIELRNGFVGVNEACSGVKTLQAAIMVALVLGELFALKTGRRAALLIAGCVWVFAANILRATTLVIIAARAGTDALGRWHDLIGTVVVVIGMAGLISIAWILRPREIPAEPERASSNSSAPQSLARPLLGLAWLALIFGATELWYRGHETHLLTLPAWGVRWPEETSAAPAPIAEETRAILCYNDAQSAVWENPPAIRWWGFFARWEPQRTALQLVRSHSPEICLPAMGRTFKQEMPALTIETDAVPLQFRAFEFEQNHQPLYVFVCIQEDKIAPTAPPNEWNARGRFLAAWRGERNLGQRLLEIAVVGFDEFPPARAAFAQTVREMVRRTEPTG